jgi:hypothetical protein
VTSFEKKTNKTKNLKCQKKENAKKENQKIEMVGGELLSPLKKDTITNL